MGLSHGVSQGIEPTHQEQQAEEQEKKKGKKGKKKEDSANLEDLTVDESKLPSLFAPGAGA
jgi:hypothetical protein